MSGAGAHGADDSASKPASEPVRRPHYWCVACQERIEADTFTANAGLCERCVQTF